MFDFQNEDSVLTLVKNGSAGGKFAPYEFADQFKLKEMTGKRIFGTFLVRNELENAGQSQFQIQHKKAT